jgi:hypothetical protein
LPAASDAEVVDEPHRHERLQAEVDAGRTETAAVRRLKAPQSSRLSPRSRGWRGPPRCGRAGARLERERDGDERGQHRDGQVPDRPSTSTAGVIRIGPSAKPALPPTENRLMPVPRARAGRSSA